MVRAETAGIPCLFETCILAKGDNNIDKINSKISSPLESDESDKRKQRNEESKAMRESVSNRMGRKGLTKKWHVREDSKRPRE